MNKKMRLGFLFGVCITRKLLDYTRSNFCSDVPGGPGEKKNAVGGSWWASENLQNGTPWNIQTYI